MLDVPSMEGLGLSGCMKPASVFTEPVVNGLGLHAQEAEASACAGQDRRRGELVRVGILDNLRPQHGADSDVAKLRPRAVDDLVGGGPVATRSGNEISGADWVLLIPVAEQPGTGQDEEHLFVSVMVVERPSALAWWYRRDAVPELDRADLARHLST